jgi:integrase
MLTNIQIKTAVPKDKLYRIADSHGLAIEITPSNNKHWRYRYRFHGKASMISIGPYPLISLADARSIRDKYRLLLLDGINPSEYKSESRKNAILEKERLVTFAEMFEQWHTQNSDSWSPSHANKVFRQIHKHVLPFVGNKSIDSISTQHMVSVFKRIESYGIIETLEKVRGYTSRIFRYCVGLNLIRIDPTRDMPRDLFKKKQTSNFAHLTDTREIGKLLKLIDNYNGIPQIEVALQMAPHVFLRPAELAQLQWDEVDFENNYIKINADRMKMGLPHIVPLTQQTTHLLKRIEPITSSGNLVFPSNSKPTKSISPESLRAALRRMGVDKETHTTHGFRHMASTRLYEMGYRGDVIERQLAHGERNKVKATYNHAEYLDERRTMMQAWSDYLDKLK